MRCAAGIIALVAAGGLCWRFPLFHLVPLREARQGQQAAAFDPASQARNQWDTRLVPAFSSAPEVVTLSAALAEDFASAKKKFGHSPGFSSSSCFLVKGSGHVAAVGDDAIRVALDGPTNPPAIDLVAGPVFGNAVRDATGLVVPGDFPNSQGFNDISAALNQIVETEIIPPLRARAAPGTAVRFVGCVELDEEDRSGPWTVVPLKTEWP